MIQRGRAPVAAAGAWLERYPFVLPLCILVLGACFRFYNLDWDSGHQLHPDERWIYEVVSGANNNPPLSWPTSLSQFLDVKDPTGGSPLNPHFFAYGTLPFYLLALLAGSISFLGQHLPLLSQWAQVDTYGALPSLGRALSGILDLIGVLLVFLLGRRVYGYWTGVLAMALVGFTVLDIQLSHFYAVDTVLLPFTLATLLAAVEMTKSESRAPYIWGGIVFGAALATKTTALLLVIPLGAAAILGAWSSGAWPRSGSLVARLRSHYSAVAPSLNRNLQWVLGTYILGAVAFVCFEPYAVLDRPQLLHDLIEQTNILVTNDPPFGVPFTIQYAHTIPYVFQIQNMLFWTMGIPLALAAFAGVLFALRHVPSFRRYPDRVVLLLWVVPYFLFVGKFFAKFNRYMLPITPVITLLGAALLVWAVRHFRARWRVGAVGATAAVVAVSFLYSLAYMNIYAHPNTRVAASSWIYSHIPAGSTISVETPWDDPLPLDEDGHIGGSTYHFVQLDLYAGEDSTTDEAGKLNNLTQALTGSTYIVMSSERMIGSIPKLPLRYPITVRYYNLLMAGKLNFRLVRVFQEHPQLGPVVVHDYPADESFHVYDHPIVRIFKQVRPISAAAVQHLLTTGLPSVPASVDPATLPVILRPATPIPDHRLMLSSSQWRADARGGTYDSMFPGNGFGMQHPFLVWLVLLELLGLLAFPFVYLVLGSLPDRGFVIAKTTGLLLWAYAIWMAVNVGASTYGRGLIAAVLLLFACVSALAAYRLRGPMLSFLRERWRAVAVGEAVFLIGFAVFLALRMWYPDLGHQFSPVSGSNLGDGRMGEKQMELAYLNAIVRSRVFPPYDPFFAHGYINYYYYGLYLVGTLCKLTGIAPAIGFNLAIATFFAMLVANVYSVGLGITRRIMPGIIAAVFVGILGNLNGGWQLLRGLMGVATVHAEFPIVGGIVDVVSGVQQVMFAHATLPPFDFWEPRSILPGGGINEFPYFTYLFADLHPHLIAFPMTVAALAFAVNLLQGGERRARDVALSFVVGGVLLGAIAVTNPWDYPTYLLVVGLGALVGAYAWRRQLSWTLAIWPAVWVVILAAISAVLYLPFKQSYETVFATGIGFVRDLTPQVIESSGLCTDTGNVCPDLAHDVLVTPLRLYLEHFGLFAFILISLLAVLSGPRFTIARRIRRAVTWVQFSLYYRQQYRRIRRISRVVGRMTHRGEEGMDASALWGALILVAGLAALGYYLLAFLVGILCLISLVVVYKGTRLRSGELFVLGLLGLGVLLSALTQLFFIRDFLAGGFAFRMNTLFKFYNQIWVLFAVAAACALYYLGNRATDGSEWDEGGNPRGNGEVTPTVRPRGNVTPDGRSGLLSALLASRPLASLRFQVAQSLPGSASPVTLTRMAFATDAVGDASAAAPVEAAPVEPEGAHHRTEGEPDPWGMGGTMQFLERHRLWSSCLGVLLLAALIYTYAGTVSRETYRTSWLQENSVPFTLDGMAFMKVAYPDEYRAINWLNANVNGAQVIAEAGDAGYNWRSRVSMFTGLPDIINGIHESEQRWPDEIDPSSLCNSTRDPANCQAHTHARPDDLKTLYDSPNISDAWRVIHQYDVRYIFVGFSERQCVQSPNVNECYSRAGLAKFDRMVGHGLRVAFKTPGVTIYQVAAA